LTVQLLMSMTLSDGLERPLLVTTAYRPSGETTMFSGKVLNARCLPAGARRQPFARSIVPSVCVPGSAAEGGALCARIHIVVTATTISVAQTTMMGRRVRVLFRGLNHLNNRSL